MTEKVNWLQGTMKLMRDMNMKKIVGIPTQAALSFSI